VLACRQSETSGLHPDESHFFSPEEGGEDPHGVAAAAHARHHRRGDPPPIFRNWRMHSFPITDWKSRTIIG